VFRISDIVAPPALLHGLIEVLADREIASVLLGALEELPQLEGAGTVLHQLGVVSGGGGCSCGAQGSLLLGLLLGGSTGLPASLEHPGESGAYGVTHSGSCRHSSRRGGHVLEPLPCAGTLGLRRRSCRWWGFLLGLLHRRQISAAPPRRWLCGEDMAAPAVLAASRSRGSRTFGALTRHVLKNLRK